MVLAGAEPGQGARSKDTVRKPPGITAGLSALDLSAPLAPHQLTRLTQAFP